MFLQNINKTLNYWHCKNLLQYLHQNVSTTTPMSFVFNFYFPFIVSSLLKTFFFYSYCRENIASLCFRKLRNFFLMEEWKTSLEALSFSKANARLRYTLFSLNMFQTVSMLRYYYRIIIDTIIIAFFRSMNFQSMDFTSFTSTL